MSNPGHHEPPAAEVFPSAGEPGGDADASAAIFAEINITPLTDVFLVLLILFMVGSSIAVDQARQASLEVTLPTAAPGAGTANVTDAIPIVLTREGSVTLMGDLLNLTDLSAKLLEAQRQYPTRRVILEADKEVPHGTVIKVLSAVQKLGIKDLALGIEAESP